jgi:hypothetical protein
MEIVPRTDWPNQCRAKTIRQREYIGKKNEKQSILTSPCCEHGIVDIASRGGKAFITGLEHPEVVPTRTATSIAGVCSVQCQNIDISQAMFQVRKARRTNVKSTRTIHPNILAWSACAKCRSRKRGCFGLKIVSMEWSVSLLQGTSGIARSGLDAQETFLHNIRWIWRSNYEAKIRVQRWTAFLQFLKVP